MSDGSEHPEIRVNVIGDGAFRHCVSLTKLCLDQGLQRIGKAAFHGCNGLTQVDVPLTVEVIDDGAFQNCKSLKSLYIKGWS
eukprot:scaffold4843_cov83-Cylindrotheca_fusiformis.AAC.1